LRQIRGVGQRRPASRHPSPKVAAFVAFMAANLLREPPVEAC
jgi:hypothetical protein